MSSKSVVSNDGRERVQSMKRLYVALGILGAIMVVTCVAVEAPGIVYLIVLGILAVVGFFLAPMFKQADAMLSSGQIIQRDPGFVEMAQTFTLAKATQEEIVAAFKREGLPFAGLEWKTAEGAMGFRYNGWTAEIISLGSADGRDRYRFSFTGWRTVGSSCHTVADITQMNQLLTAIEKAFLKLDSSTKVQTERIKVKSQSKLF